MLSAKVVLAAGVIAKALSELIVIFFWSGEA